MVLLAGGQSGGQSVSPHYKDLYSLSVSFANDVVGFSNLLARMLLAGTLIRKPAICAIVT